MHHNTSIGEVLDLCKEASRMDKHRLGKRYYEAQQWLKMLATYFRKKFGGKRIGNKLHNVDLSQIRYVDMSVGVEDERILRIFIRLHHIVHGHFGHHYFRSHRPLKDRSI